MKAVTTMHDALLFSIVIVMMLGVSAVGTVLIMRVEAVRNAHGQPDGLDAHQPAPSSHPDPDPL